MPPKHQQSKHYNALLESIAKLDDSLNDVDERVYNAITSPESEAPREKSSHLPGLDVQPIPLNFNALFPAKLGRLAISEPNKETIKKNKPLQKDSRDEAIPKVSTPPPTFVVKKVAPKEAVTKESITLPTQFNSKLNSQLEEKLADDKKARASTRPKLKEKQNKAAQKMDGPTQKPSESDGKKTIGKSLKNDAELQKELDAREKKIQDLLDGSKGSSISSGTV